MAFSSRTAEKLIILKETGNGLLQRVHQTKRVFSGPFRPTFTTDPQLQRVVAALTKKFPDFDAGIEKTPGYELLTGKAKLCFEELEPHYFALVDTYEWKEAALPVLNEVASGTVEMKLDENPTLVSHFLDLFTTYVQLNLLVTSFEDRKLVMATYFKLYNFIKLLNEPNYSKVANYLVLFDVPIKAMQEEFKSLSASLGKTLVNFMPLFSKLRTVPLLRKEGAINISLKPEEMNRPVTDKFRYQMTYSYNMYSWIVYGFLLCPETLSLPGAMDLCQAVLRDGWVIPVYRNTTINIHQDYQNLFENYKSKNLNLQKQKKVPKEALVAAGTTGLATRKQKRVYLRQELNSLLHLIKDKPCLLGPKFQLVLSALSLAKEEIFWYFRHAKSPIPKALEKKKLTEEEIRDNKISELIFLVESFANLIRQNKKVVQQYYIEYLKTTDFTKISELCEGGLLNMVGQGPAAIIRAILEDIPRLNEGELLSGKQNLKVLRLNWFRVESALSSIQSSVPISKVKDAIERFNLIINHSRFVDDIDALLDSCASLKGLYYWKDLFYEVFDRAIKDGPNQPLHVISFIQLASEFPSNVTIYNADERDEVGKDCVHLTEKMLTEVSNRIAALLNEIARSYIIFDNQLADSNAAYPLLIKRRDYKPAKDSVAPETPGSESAFNRRPQLDKLRLFERNAWQLCSILNEVEAIVVFDTKFAPREYLRDKLCDILRKFIRSASIVEVKDEKHVERYIQRPTVLERQLNMYISVLKLVEGLVDLDVSELVREVLLSELYINPVGKAGSFDWVNVDDQEFKYESPVGPKIVGFIVGWYSDFVSKKLNIPGICYSPNRFGFVSRTGLSFRAEYYADLDELKALCRLIGPYGIRLIEREVLKYILSNVTTIKDFLAHNKQALEELAAGYHNESSCNEALKKLRDSDTFVNKSITIGNALLFRDLLHTALRQTLEERAGYIYEVVSNMFKQYGKNTYMANDLLPGDALANDVGLELGTTDQALKRFLSKAFTTTDGPLINLLPYLYASSFISTLWREAQFRPLIEAYNNNAHAISKCINSLIVATKSIVSSEKVETEIQTLLKTFVEVSSVILLRIARAKQDKTSPVEFPSVIIFMDSFIQESPLLTQNILEGSMPYALLRNHWRTVYAPKVGRRQEAVDTDAF